MYLIKRLWIDPMENRNAYGYTNIGFVKSLQKAKEICSSVYISKEDYPWPLKNAYEFKEDLVPRFKYEEIPDLEEPGVAATMLL